MEATKENTMTSTEIVDIIRACGKCGVRSFRLGLLQIQFDEPTEIASSPKIRSKRTKHGQTLPDQNQNPEQLELEELERIEAEFNRGQMSLTDPSAFEALQLEGENNEAST